MNNMVYLFLALALTATCGSYVNAAENLAIGAKATASSVERGDCSATNAIDGRGNTRWSSKRGDNEWLLVDIGSPKTVAQIQLDWEAAAGKEYSIQFSNDGQNFTDVYTVTDGKPGAREYIRIKPQETRYIRLLGKKRATRYGYSLWEMKVFAEHDSLVYGATVTASSTQGNYKPQNVIDGRDTTRWSSNRNDNEWIMLDLGEDKSIGKIVLKWEEAAGKEYSVQVSSDGENFTEVFRKTDGKKKATETIVIDPVTARFVRIQGIKRASTYGYSLWEGELYSK